MNDLGTTRISTRIPRVESVFSMHGKRVYNRFQMRFSMSNNTSFKFFHGKKTSFKTIESFNTMDEETSF